MEPTQGQLNILLKYLQRNRHYTVLTSPWQDENGIIEIPFEATDDTDTYHLIFVAVENTPNEEMPPSGINADTLHEMQEGLLIWLGEHPDTTAAEADLIKVNFIPDKPSKVRLILGPVVWDADQQEILSMDAIKD